VTGLIVDTLAAADQSGDRDDGTNAMQAAVTARAAYNVIANQGTGLIGISLSESVGYTKSEQSGSSRSDTAAASSLTAGEILDVVAGKNITVIGSDLEGKQVNLDAAEDIFLHSQQEITNDGHKENSSNASVGAVAYVQLGGPTGVAYGVNITANFGTSQGKGNTDTLTHRETTVTGSEGVAITSGNNTELIGALVFGETVKLDAGGNLIIRSEQDVYNTSEKSQSAGVNVSIPLPIPGTIPASMSMGGNYQDQNASGHIQTVQEQTGIYAGTGGYTINVGNQTSLTGGVISSEADAKLNHLTTGSLVLEDLKNTSEWNAETTGFSGNFSEQVNAKEGDPVIPSQVSATPTLGQEEGDSDNGMTRSAISAGEITLKNGGDLSGINRDTAITNAGSLSMGAIPNLSETLAQQADRSAVAAQASAVVAQTVGDVSDAMSNGSLVENGFEEGGIYRAGLHGLSQGIVAGLGGGNAAAAGAAAGATSYFAPTFNTGNEETDKLLGNLVSGGLGFAIGGNSGAFASSSVDANNRQLHDNELNKIKALAESYAAQKGISAEEAFNLLLAAAYGMVDGASDALNDRQGENYQAAMQDAAAFILANSTSDLFQATHAERFDNEGEEALAQRIRNASSEAEVQRLLLDYVASQQTGLLTGKWATADEQANQLNIAASYKDYNEALRLGAYSALVDAGGSGFWESSAVGQMFQGGDDDFIQTLLSYPDWVFAGILKPNAEQASNSLFTGAALGWELGEDTRKLENLYTTTIAVRNTAAVGAVVVGGVVAGPAIIAGYTECSLLAGVYGTSALSTINGTTLLTYGGTGMLGSGTAITVGDALAIGGTAWLFGSEEGREYFAMVASSGLPPQMVLSLLGLDEAGAIMGGGRER